MDLIIILIIWIALGMIYFGTLIKSNKYDGMSEGALAFTFLMFLPTTIVLLLLIMIMETFEFIEEKITNGKG